MSFTSGIRAPSSGTVSVLIVDDDAAMVETLELIFEAKGYHTESASSGAQALALLERRAYNVALLDITLPGISGTELLTHARRLQPDMKCIMVTGNTDFDSAVDALNKGAYAYVRKPFEVPDVAAVVGRALKEQSLEFTNRAFSELARNLVEHIGLDERLELISSFLIRVTGMSRCAVWLLNREALTPVYVTGLDEEQRRRLARAELTLDEVSSALAAILDSGKATPVADARSLGLIPEEFLDRWEVRHALLIPLRSGGRLVGVAAVAEPQGVREFSQDQIERAQTIANMAAVAVQQAKTIQEERETLQTLAHSFLTLPPVREDLKLASRYEAAAEVAKIGGDYFDFVEFDDHRLGVVIGDVCGKGLAAAIYTGKAKDMFRAYALENFENARALSQPLSPQWVLTRLNRALCYQMSDMFVTMVYGVLDTYAQTFTYTNAGHPHPLLFQPCSESLLEIKPAQGGEGPTDGLVGAVEEMEFTEQTVALEHGSVLAMFTDGVTEARTGLEMLEISGVREVVQAHATESADAIADAIFTRAREFASGVLRDDVAIVVIRHEPTQRGS
jgi:serine phosphatase RsbU (regulator of sigma subunit)/DNA-binding response OmpR family regulator